MRFKFHQLLFAGASGALVLSTVSGVAAQSTQSLLALSKRNHTLAIVDSKTLQVLARVPVGPDPHEVIASRLTERRLTSPSTVVAATMRSLLSIWSDRRRCLR